MKIDFTGQVVMVTGATRGIGKQIADSFSLCGADLILTGTPAGVGVLKNGDDVEIEIEGLGLLTNHVGIN